MSEESTRDRLLATARRVFAQDGFEGASIRTITREAEVNLGAVTYHFGSKEELYHEVLRQVLTPLRNRMREVASGNDVPVEKRVEAVVRGFFEHLVENPDQPRFMVELRLSSRPIPPPIQELIDGTASELMKLIQEGQAQGVIRDGSPLLHVFSLISQPIFTMLVTVRIGGHLPVDPDTEEGRAALVEHMVRFALDGLSTTPPDPGPSGEET